MVVVDKSIGTAKITLKSVRTQYDPLRLSGEREDIKKNAGGLKVKIIQKKQRSTGSNTELSFSPESNVIFSVEDKCSNLPCNLDESISTIPDDDCDSSYLPEEEDSCSSDEETPENEEHVGGWSEDINNPTTEPKFVVFWSSLILLFQTCFTCHESARISKIFTRGTLLILTITCLNHHTFKWMSQPRIGSMGMGNLLLASAILYSGNTYNHIKEMMDVVNLKLFGSTVYTGLQKKILFPSINYVYKKHRNKIMDSCRLIGSLNLAGDGRSDSPGFNAKYGTYTLMDITTNKILDFYVVHVNSAGNSARMEKKGLQVLLEKMKSCDLKVASLTTDRHIQIRSFIKTNIPK